MSAVTIRVAPKPHICSWSYCNWPATTALVVSGRPSLYFCEDHQPRDHVNPLVPVADLEHRVRQWVIIGR